MTKQQAINQFKNELMEQQGARTWGEVVATLGKTTIRCCWSDYIDYLIKDKEANEKRATRWGQFL